MTGRSPATPANDPAPLLAPDASVRVARGGLIRVGGYGTGMLATAAASVLLLRHLGVKDFGRYTTVTSIVAIVAVLTDPGLMTVGGRDLALLNSRAKRHSLVANLLGLRLLLTPLGVVLAIGFAIVAGYSNTLIVGTLLAGCGLVISACQSTIALPLAIHIRIGTQTLLELSRQILLLAGIAALAVAGSHLLPFFALPIGIGLLVLGLTARVVRPELQWRPAMQPGEWRRLVRDTLPLALSFVIDTVYFRLLVVIVSLLGTAVATGLYAASFRLVDVLYGLLGLVGTTTLPLLAVVSADLERLRGILQRLTEVALLSSCYIVLILAFCAKPALTLLGGTSYAAAAPTLRVQVFALIPVSVGHVWQAGLIAMQRQRVLVVANAVAFAAVMSVSLLLVPRTGATGAATAAVAAESIFSTLLLVSLSRTSIRIAADGRFAAKICLAAGCACAAFLAPGIPVLGAACVATVVYAAVVWLTRALPRDVVAALIARDRRLSSAEPKETAAIPE